MFNLKQLCSWKDISVFLGMLPGIDIGIRIFGVPDCRFSWLLAWKTDNQSYERVYGGRHQKYWIAVVPAPKLGSNWIRIRRSSKRIVKEPLPARQYPRLDAGVLQTIKTNSWKKITVRGVEIFAIGSRRGTIPEKMCHSWLMFLRTDVQERCSVSSSSLTSSLSQF